jgi:hypothetical protein
VSSSTLSASERRGLALAAFAVLLTRLPWIRSGYGSDPDGYRVMSTARQLARTGQYTASRFPGYPAYEYLCALSANAPPWVSNAVTAMFSVAAFVWFALMLRELRVRPYLLLALGFAMVPVIYLNSCCTMDYIPSLAFMLAASYGVLRGSPALAGAMLGLAIGCRLTAGALALPLCLWMLWSLDLGAALRQCVKFGSTALLVTALCFLPVYRVYGTQFLTFFDNDGYPPFDVVLSRATMLVWGAFGCLGLVGALMALPIYHREARRAWQQPFARNAWLVALLTTLLFLSAFMRLPDEAGYLVPLVPWVIVMIALLTPPRVASVFALALLLSPWIAFDHLRPTLDGAILEDHRVRRSQEVATLAVIDAVKRLPGRAAVVCGWVLPRITLMLGGDRLGEHQFIYLVEDDGDYRRYLAEGRQIYYLPGVDLYESQAHQLELAELGAQLLPVPRERQRPASTGE